MTNIKINNGMLIRFVASMNSNLFVISTILSLLSGLTFALIFPLVMYALSPQPLITGSNSDWQFSYFNSPNSNLAKIFIIVCLFTFLAKTLSHISNNILSHRMSVYLRKSIYDAVSRSSIFNLEKVGYERVLSAINIDVANVVSGAITVPGLISSATTLIGLLTYMAYLNLDALIFITCIIIFGTLTFYIISTIAEKYLKQSRDVFDKVQIAIKGLVHGSKELKISRLKAEIHRRDELDHYEEVALRKYLTGNSIFLFAMVYAEALLFFILGIVAFHLYYIYRIGDVEIIGIVMAILFISGPISYLLHSAPNIFRGNLGLKKIIGVINDLPSENCSFHNLAMHDWSQIILKGVAFEYSYSLHNTFGIRDVNLTLERGKIYFLVGGNGSGKSTLAKILGLLYKPTRGSISFDGIEITEHNISAARLCYASVFTDYFLFDRFYGECAYDSVLIDEYIKLLDLTGIVDIDENGVFSTTKLSDGQRKRLALLVALIDNKDVYVLDEWAADQDPKYKKIFYEKVLTNLAMQGKLIVVVTHDDAYFGVADVLVKMNYGEVESLICPLT